MLEIFVGDVCQHNRHLGLKLIGILSRFTSICTTHFPSVVYPFFKVAPSEGPIGKMSLSRRGAKPPVTAEGFP